MPFQCENPDDEQVRRVLQAVLSSVTLTATSETGRRQVTRFDFGAAIGLADDPRLVHEETLDYDETPELLLLENRERIRKLLASKRCSLSQSEYDRLASEPVVRAEFGDVFRSRFRRFFAVLLMAAQLDLPLVTTIELAGLKDSAYAKAFEGLRSKHVALQQLVELIAELRGPVHTFFGRIMSKAGPHKRLEVVAHPLLEHPLCQEGGAALTHEEWSAVRPALVDLLGSKHAAQRLATARMDLDYMFEAVRRRVPMSKVSPRNVGANAMRRINLLQSSGDFERLTRVLLELAGKRGAAGHYKVPLF